MKKLLLTFIFTNLFISTSFLSAQTNKVDVIMLESQGNFSAGGTVQKKSGELNSKDVYRDFSGQTVHGNHASVFYQIPVNAKKNGIVFLHGNGQSGKCWGTTPDGREGFQNIFLKNNYSVYVVDQPGRGQAVNNTKDVFVPAVYTDQMRFDQFRLGIYPDFYDGVAFSKDKNSLEQFYRQMTVTVGSVSQDEIADSLAAVFERSGNSVFFTHSAGGSTGWNVAIKSDFVKGIVAIEPGSFVFPEGEAPEPIKNLYFNGGIPTVPLNEFMKLTKIPIVIYFGDNIPKTHSKNPGQDFWYATRETAYRFAETINRHGGDAQVIDLPAEGIFGNTHFIFSDTNNAEVAEHILNWMKKKGL